jgi:hypothetical protein
MSRFRISRRELLGTAATTAFAGLVLARETSVHRDGSVRRDSDAGAGASTGAGNGPVAARGAASALALMDGMLSGDDLAQARATLAPLAPAPLAPKILEPDLLWQWRRELAQELAKGIRAVAITRWDKAILLKGLAREASLPVCQRRIARSLFQTEIG